MSVRDKRRVGPEGVVTEQPSAGSPDETAVAPGDTRAPDAVTVDAGAEKNATAEAAGVVLEARRHLENLQRLQAEFANYRKRMMREQASATERGAGRLVEKLLPVLDDFERALSHGAPLDGGPGGEGELPGGAQSPWAGVELVYRRLRGVLVEEGLEEIPSEGVPFDPTVHEAVDVSEDANLSEATAARLYRKGYRFKGHVIRAAMVGVARPPETPADDASEVRPVDSGEVVEPVEGELTDRPGPNDISEMEE